MTRPQSARLAEFRFWLAEHAATFGIGAALLLVTLVAAPILYVTSPRGPTETVEGVILAVGLLETDTGSYPRAAVQLSDQQISVSLSRRTNCVAGSILTLQRTPRIAGYKYLAQTCRDR